MPRSAFFIIACVAGAFSVFAERIDTTFAADGGPGPYRLGTRYIDSATIRVRVHPDTTVTSIPYTFLSQLNALLFSEPIDSGLAISVSYASSYQGVPKVHYLYEKRFGSLSDTSSRVFDSLLIPPRTLTSSEELTVSGYKSIGVSVGNLGQTNLEQAMDVSVFGKISDQTQLKAHLSDQGSSLDGATREISEIDMVFLTLDNPKYSVTVGDQFLTWPRGGILFGEKKVQGVSATVRPYRTSGTLFGALSGGAFAAETFRGQTGLQGPYFLNGNEEAELITPIGGTVDVFLNGQKLTEGRMEDYTVDYDFGSITFTPRNLIKEDDIIRVEYEYKVFDYQRLVAGTGIGAANADSSLRVHGALWIETDNKNHPLDLELTRADRDSLAASGDKTYTKTMFAYPVDYRDAVSVAVYTGIYVKAVDSLGRQYFRWTRTFRTDSTLYRVPFRKAPSGAGEYDSTTYCPPAMNGPCYPVYTYVGSGGDFSARAKLPSPQRKTAGEIIATAHPVPWLSARVDIAGQERDQNLFSDRNDNDNTGLATQSSLTVGNRTTLKSGAWVDLSHEYISSQFDHSVLSAAQREVDWNDTSIVTGGKDRQSWKTSAGISFGSSFSSEISYGQLWQNRMLDTDRFSLTAQSRPFAKLSATYHGNYYRHQSSGARERSRREKIRVELDLSAVNLWLGASEEWRWGNDVSGTGHVSGTAGLRLKPLQLDETVAVHSYRAGTRDLFSPDTGYSILWKQHLRHNPFKWWRIQGTSSYRLRALTRVDERSSTTIAHIRNDITATEKGFATTQDYRLSSERASMFVQVPTYVGPGLGTHRYDTTGTAGDPYVPDNAGSWSVTEQEYIDENASERIRKTRLELTWSYYPQQSNFQGILGDLDWRGLLLLNEHLGSASADTLMAWVPGLMSLSGDTTDWLSRHADLSYRQSVDWRPAHLDGWHADLFGKPFLRIIRGYRERGLEYGAGLDRTWDEWFLGSKFDAIKIFRDERPLSDSGTELYDGHGELIQRFRFAGNFEAYVTETAGKAGRSMAESNWYYFVSPGIRWRSAGRGFAEMSYTFSHLASDSALDYRLAQGRSPGTSHIFSALIDIKTGDHFSINGSYRGEIAPKSRVFDRNIHVVSIGVRAYL